MKKEMEESYRKKLIKEREELNLCDGDCNHCPIINHRNSRMITRILNIIHNRYPDIYIEVEYRCPNLTCCYDCKIDDFCHTEKGCKLGIKNEEI